MPFQLKTSYKPAGDQPKAIEQLVQGARKGFRDQTLLGVTGSGKTFTMANVIQHIQKPTLVIAHNKTLAAQLCNEFRDFFPDNAVGYFVSYYDYYQPEAYLPTSDTYIEKEAMINEEIDRLRHAATQALLTREDVIIVASVSCIYGLGSPENYESGSVQITRGEPLNRMGLARKLVDMHLERTTADLKRGSYRARGDVLEVMPVNQEVIYRIEFVGARVGEITMYHSVTRKVMGMPEMIWLFPAKHYVTSEPDRKRAVKTIREELDAQLKKFEKEGKLLEAERISRRTRYDLELIEQIGYCNGIENYSRHFDGRARGEPPYTLLDYFNHQRKGDYLMFIDESHVSVPQLGGMYAGDAARKHSLIEHGFRLPSAADNRPLKFDEFVARQGQTVYVSATPADYEYKKSSCVVEQVIRPTGLIDPEIIIHPVTATQKNISQIDDVIARAQVRVIKDERILITTLTKKMAEDLAEHLKEKKIKATYLHSDIDTLERVQILHDFRKGKTDVLVGVNLLREGLDLPEVTLVAILDADKEGFLRSETSLIQTIGRAARNVLGQVVLYADHMTCSLTRAINETNRRRALQIAYNKKHGITPQTIKKAVKNWLEEFGLSAERQAKGKRANNKSVSAVKRILDLEMAGDKGKKIDRIIKEKSAQMREAATNLEFELAAILRDELKELKKMALKNLE
ncbi:MAG: excinuclease ABC subunit UvrB [Candidatus Magasanikbacteria bacterium]|nr:excinuclease ABC subunit UvrB [Candidatus Magasanikbacteria bacterium]